VSFELLAETVGTRLLQECQAGGRKCQIFGEATGTQSYVYKWNDKQIGIGGPYGMSSSVKAQEGM